MYQAASVASYTVTGTNTNQVSIYRNTFTCSKQYRLEDENGNWSGYTADGSETKLYGSTCSYSKTVADYRGSSDAVNDAEGSTSATVTSATTLSLDFYRNAYSLTVNRNTTYISGVTGAGTYKWGQGVSISATPASGGLFNGWSQSSGTAGTFANASSASTTFTMGKGDAVIYADGKSSVKYMQDYTKATCQAEASSSNVTVVDNRDNNSYTVRYLGGNCWMTQNLRLGSDSQIKLTVDNTDLASTDVYDSGQDGWYTPAVQTSGSDSWQNPVDAKHIYQQSDTNYGNLYNWYTATAGTGTSNMTNSDASSSICPKGWKLPPNTGTGSYTELMQATVSSNIATSGTNTTYINAFQAAPLSFVLSGLYDSGLSTQGTDGYYWSRTAYSSSVNAHYFLLYSSGYYNLQNSGRKYLGFAVRCILENRTISDVTYMQDVTSGIVNNTAEGATATLTDRRDNNTYTVAKINGNLWMTSNLRITGTISATDSNFTGNDVNISEGDLTSGNSYDEPRTHTGTDNNGNPTVWYNYAAATAKTITGDSNSTNATQDICPKGWRLPTGGYSASSSEQQALTDAIGSSPAAFSPVTGGVYNGGSLNYTGYGYWWSATALNSTNRYRLYYNGSSLGTNHYGSRYDGFFVRCILETRTISDVTYMQDVTDGIVKNTATGATATLKDKRDEKEYTVTKQADGNLWMTQNLRLGSDSQIKLTVDNTDLVSTSVYDSGSDGWYTPAVQTSGSDSWQNPVDAKHIYQQSDTNYGNLYNWYTATAGTGTSNMTNSDASSSICPKGWKLPPNTGTGSYTELMQATVNSSIATRGTNTTYTNAFQAAPLSFVLSGVYISKLHDPGTYGGYWSRTAYSSSDAARGFSFYSSGDYNLQVNYYKYGGYALRCVRVS